MTAVKRTRFMEFIWKIHPWVYRASGGRILGSIEGMPVLLLTTTGRKSGAPRTSPLLYLPQGESCVVIGSYAGEPRHPAWFLNLQTNPRAEVQVRDRRSPVVAREAEGEERERLWSEVVERETSYAEYQQRTTHRIPVVVLQPVPQSRLA